MIKLCIFFMLLFPIFSYGTKNDDSNNKQNTENSKRILIVKPKDEEKTNITKEKNNNFPDKNNSDNQIKTEEIFHESIQLFNIDSSELVPKLKDISTAKITGMDKEIIVKGSMADINEIKYIIKKFDKPKKQIKIKATIIDTSDNLFERLGIDFSSGKNTENNSSNFNASFLDGNFSLTSILKQGGSFLGINIDALKETGDIKIEAMPVLVILEGEEAELKVTEEVIIGEKKFSNKNDEYIEPIFAEAGVLFKIKPEIRNFSDSKEILLSIDSEISNFKLSSNFNTNQGAKQKNKINTTISIKDGSSVFIGGLKQNVQKDSEKRVPVLSNIPILGSLFKYKRKNKEIRDIYIEIEGKIQID